MTAMEMAERIRKRDISAREVMAAHLEQINRINPVVNAIITHLPDDQALELADEADTALASGEQIGPLHGLPIAHKDLELTAGMRTTFGSPIFKDFVPDQSSLVVERLKQAGALRIGKTNTPEFGAGSHTFNEVFGATLNPYDTSKTCGGSSGGAAVALACGMQPIADGSDHGGSLRNPGNFNNIVGFRPSPGRVPNFPSPNGYYQLAVKGPMARTVQDVALMLSAIAGPDSRVPISLPEPGETFRQPLNRETNDLRIAWSPDLGGLPVDSQVTGVLEAALPVFTELGCNVEEANLDLNEADEVFLINRAWTFATGQRENLEKHRHHLKDTVIWNAEEGMNLSAVELGDIEIKRTNLHRKMTRFFEKYDFLVCPVNQVPPFDVDIDYPREINGVEMENYISWMKSAYFISALTLPAISVPAGFTGAGLPVGIQIVGKHRDDFGVLQMAYAFEQATQFGLRRPPVVTNSF